LVVYETHPELQSAGGAMCVQRTTGSAKLFDLSELPPADGLEEEIRARV